MLFLSSLDTASMGPAADLCLLPSSSSFRWLSLPRSTCGGNSLPQPGKRLRPRASLCQNQPTNQPTNQRTYLIHLGNKKKKKEGGEKGFSCLLFLAVLELFSSFLVFSPMLGPSFRTSLFYFCYCHKLALEAETSLCREASRGNPAGPSKGSSSAASRGIRNCPDLVTQLLARALLTIHLLKARRRQEQRHFVTRRD